MLSLRAYPIPGSLTATYKSRVQTTAVLHVDVVVSTSYPLPWFAAALEREDAAVKSLHPLHTRSWSGAENHQGPFRTLETSGAAARIQNGLPAFLRLLHYATPSSQVC